MSIAKTLDALNHFLAEHNIRNKDVRVIIEFDDEIKAQRFAHAVRGEFRYCTYDRLPPLKSMEQRIYGIPLSIKTEIKIK